MSPTSRQHHLFLVTEVILPWRGSHVSLLDPPSQSPRWCPHTLHVKRLWNRSLPPSSIRLYHCPRSSQHSCWPHSSVSALFVYPFAYVLKLFLYCPYTGHNDDNKNYRNVHTDGFKLVSTHWLKLLKPSCALLILLQIFQDVSMCRDSFPRNKRIRRTTEKTTFLHNECVRHTKIITNCSSKNVKLG